MESLTERDKELIEIWKYFSDNQLTPENIEDLPSNIQCILKKRIKAEKILDNPYFRITHRQFINFLTDHLNNGQFQSWLTDAFHFPVEHDKTESPLNWIMLIDELNGPDYISTLKSISPSKISTTVKLSLISSQKNMKHPAVNALILALKDNDDEVRKTAAEILGDIEDPRAVVPLIQALGDRNLYSVSYNASLALSKIGKPAIDELCVAIKDSNADVRWRAVQTLGNIGDVRALEPLIISLKDEDKTVREWAAEALGKIKDIRSVEPLIHSLSDKNNEVRKNAAEALGNIGDTKAVKSLILALGDHDYRVRGYAAEALQKIGNPAIDPLCEAIKDSNSDVRWCAAWVFGNIGDIRGVGPLIQTLQDSNPTVRCCVIEALQKIGIPAIHLLNKALEDTNPEIKKGAIETLHRIGKPAIDALVTALSDSNNTVRNEAIKNLQFLEKIIIYDPLYLNLKENLKSYHYKVCGDNKKIKIVKPAVLLLKDSENNVRFEVVNEIGRSEGIKILEPIIYSINEMYGDDKHHLLTEIGSIEHIAITEFLRLFLNEREDTHRKALNILGNIGDKKNVNFLLKFLIYPYENRNWQNAATGVIEALGNIGDKKAVEPLLISMKSNQCNISQWEVEKALNKVNFSPSVSISLKLYILGYEWLIKEKIIGNKKLNVQNNVILNKSVNSLDINELIEDLKDKNPIIRLRAVHDLGNISDERVVYPLIDALRDIYKEVRINAAEILGNMGNQSAVFPLSFCLKDIYIEVREKAVEALGKIGDATAVESIVIAMKDPNRDKNIRLKAVNALGNIDDSKAVEALIKEYVFTHLSVNPYVYDCVPPNVFSKIWAPLPESQYYLLKRHYNDGVIKNNNSVVNTISENNLESLIIALQDNDWNVRLNAIEALRNCKDKRIVESLIQAITDEDEDIRWRAAEALGNIGDSEAIVSLVKALKDNDWNVRMMAAEALGNIDDTRAVDHLIEALKDDNVNVRLRAVEALYKKGDEKSVEQVKFFFNNLEDEGNTKSIVTPENLKSPIQSFYNRQKQVITNNDINLMGQPFEEKIVGVSYDDCQKYIKSLSVGDIVFLLREPENPYDQNAIKVVNSNGDKLGYIARNRAIVYSPYLDRLTFPLNAQIASLYNDNLRSYNIGLTIQFTLPNSDELNQV
jgi:HEAT repeat protein